MISPPVPTCGAARGLAIRSHRATGHKGAPGSDGHMAAGEAVEVVGPTHPLYGRRFPLLSITDALRSAGYARVEYRQGVVLMLPLPVTSLGLNPVWRTVRTKLNIEALTELVSVAGESERACPSSPATSGVICPRTSAGRSRSTSAPCCGR